MSVITADFYPPRRFLSFNLLILNRRSKMPFWRTQVKPRQTLVNSASHMKGKSPNITQANAWECIASSYQAFKTNTFITRESLLCQFSFLESSIVLSEDAQACGLHIWLAYVRGHNHTRQPGEEGPCKSDRGDHSTYLRLKAEIWYH